MLVDVNESESVYLSRLLDEAHTELLRELHKADALEFRRFLRDDLELNERLRRKIVAEPIDVVSAV